MIGRDSSGFVASSCEASGCVIYGQFKPVSTPTSRQPLAFIKPVNGEETMASTTYSTLPPVASTSRQEAPYRYQDLTQPGTIRMFVLDAGQPHEPLKGSLEIVPANHAGSYEALSYVWADAGPAERPYEILLRAGNDETQSLPLKGGSIFAALCQLRLPDRPRRIWADQCCINQEDLVERSHQVQHMSKIYENASHVLVWLGLDTNNEAVPAFSLIKELDQVLKFRFPGEISRELHAKSLEIQIRLNHSALDALTNRPWFKRGWIVQEIGTRTPATMIWGDHAIEWEQLARVCQKLKGYHQLRSTLGITTSDISFLYQRFIEPDKNTHHANRYNFVYELQRSRHLQFSDQRDRVFAFLGHFSVHEVGLLGCGPISVKADYTRSVEETYMNVAVRILRDNPDAACIILASVQHPQHSLPFIHDTAIDAEESLQKRLEDHSQLPSWVPDWRRSGGIILAEPICPHRAHGDSVTKIEIMQNPNLALCIHGMEIDTINVCSNPLHSSSFYTQRTSDYPWSMIEGLWHKICHKQVFELNDKYLTGQSAFYAFAQSLSNGCVQATGHECVEYDTVPEDVWLQKAARYVIEVLGESDVVSDELRAVAAQSRNEEEHETWSRWAASASDGRVFATTELGYYVLGPGALEVGDVVCVFLGCKMPFCLRPIGDRYLLVGECYVHGLMKGEAIESLARNDIEEKVFVVL